MDSVNAACIIVALLAVAYAIHVHNDNDRYLEENYWLRRALHMIADGTATVHKTNGLIQIKEKE